MHEPRRTSWLTRQQRFLLLGHETARRSRWDAGVVTLLVLAWCVPLCLFLGDLVGVVVLAVGAASLPVQLLLLRVQNRWYAARRALLGAAGSEEVDRVVLAVAKGTDPQDPHLRRLAAELALLAHLQERRLRRLLTGWVAGALGAWAAVLMGCSLGESVFWLVALGAAAMGWAPPRRRLDRLQELAGRSGLVGH